MRDITSSEFRFNINIITFEFLNFTMRFFLNIFSVTYDNFRIILQDTRRDWSHFLTLSL